MEKLEGRKAGRETGRKNHKVEYKQSVFHYSRCGRGLQPTIYFSLSCCGPSLRMREEQQDLETRACPLRQVRVTLLKPPPAPRCSAEPHTCVLLRTPPSPGKGRSGQAPLLEFSQLRNAENTTGPPALRSLISQDGHSV